MALAGDDVAKIPKECIARADEPAAQNDYHGQAAWRADYAVFNIIHKVNYPTLLLTTLPVSSRLSGCRNSANNNISIRTSCVLDASDRGAMQCAIFWIKQTPKTRTRWG